MSPRKRVRPNPADGSSASLPITTASQSSTTSQTPAAASSLKEPGIARRQQSNTSTASAASSQRSLKQVHKARSWYGSWPRAPKSSASTQVARETILGDTSKPPSIPDFSRYDTKKSSDSVSVNEPSESAAGLPNIPENGSTTPKDDVPTERVQPKLSKKDAPGTTEQEDAPMADSPLPVLQPSTSPPSAAIVERPSTATGSGWLGWLSRPTGAAPTPTPAPTPTTVQDQATEAIKEPEAEIPATPTPKDTKDKADTTQTPGPNKQSTPGASWFGFWSATPQPNKVSGPMPDQDKVLADSTADTTAVDSNTKDSEDVGMPDVPPMSPPGRASAGSTWAFWSRDTGTKSKGRTSDSQEEGQLAVMGEGSEAHPKPASGVEVKDSTSKPPSVQDKPAKQATTQESSSKKNKRLRPKSMEMEDTVPSRPDTPSSQVSNKGEIAKQPAKASTPPKQSTSNLLLPSFKKTYRMKENPSILRQITQLLLRTQQPPAKHVFLTSEPPKIKKAVAIGVHGLFPAAYLRPMIGQPTGTSIKFANHCAEGIRRWANAHGCEDCEIEKVALEGEGKIGERVENLWKLLLNWIDHIRSADLVILACHSQGVPVGIMLVAKLIELGIIGATRIGVCAMAGVSLGPFPDYRSGMGMLMGSAHELWEFANPDSEISKRYRRALDVVLDYGVRITYVGSIDDQVVPLESAINSPATHPYIFRAVFIDGRIHAPDFIAHLVGFACKLRNLGISDHGLIRELSVPLAGSLYSGEGHSRLYDDDQVYDLAVTHALETTSVGKVPAEIRKHEAMTNPNPYHLPWIMRGMLEEDFVKTDLSAETAELLTQFDDWKPTTKALKDVKYRLEAVRSKL